MAPRAARGPRLVGPYDRIQEDGAAISTFRAVGFRKSRGRPRPPIAHAKLALLGNICWTDEHPAGFVDDHVWFAPKRLWVSSANFTYASRRSLEFGYDYAIKRGHLPSVSEYHTNITRLVRYFRGLGVRDFGVWDEANHASQPTDDSPSHAALFFVQMYRAVKGGCSTCGVVALDVLDQTGVERYMRDFFRRLSPTYRARATVVGIHNYGDVNRRRTTFTRAIIQEAHHYNSHTRFWLTETGGIVRFGADFPYSPARAASRLSEMFSIADRCRRSGIDRMYVYQWTGAQRGDRFDAGLTNPDGSVRPGYTYLRKKLPGYER